MSVDLRERAEAFKAELRKKIDNLLKEFSDGKISREQFQIIYERYHNQLAIADDAAMGLNENRMSTVQNAMPTIAIKQASRGRAVGMGIYHHRSGVLIETLGEFDISPEIISPIIGEFSRILDEGKTPEDKTLRTKEGVWIAFIASKYTSVITLFKNEPSGVQIKQTKQLLADFETANSVLLDVEAVDSSKLAYPFQAIVQKRLKKK